MGSKKLRNHDRIRRDPTAAPVVVPGFEKIDQLANAIEAPFLKTRTHAYVESARELADVMAQYKDTDIDVEAFREGVSYEFEAYAKNARLIDFILSVSGSSQYQSENGRQIARTICQAVETRLSPYIAKQDNGTITLMRSGMPDPTLVERTHSRSGRWIARQFARVVPQAQGK